jgi:hypothetical protein
MGNLFRRGAMTEQPNTRRNTRMRDRLPQARQVVAATGADGGARAMIIFLWDDHYFSLGRSPSLLFPFFTQEELRARRAVSLLLWTGIELAHSRGLWFDYGAGLAKLSRYKFLISFGEEIANR